MIIREFTGKTTQEAIDTGLAELGVTIADVRVDVLQEGAKGLFGLFGSKPARVRISVMEDDGPQEDLSIHWSIDEEKPQKKAKKQTKQEQTKAPEVKKSQPETQTTEEVKKPAVREEIKTAEAKPFEPAEKKETVPAQRERKPKERKPREQKARNVNPEAKRDPMVPAKPFQPTEAPVVFPEDTPAGRAQHFLMEVTEKMGVKVDVYVDESREDALGLRLIGDTLGILIGRRGETLDALQYLTSLQVNKGNEEYIRVTLDTENYRAKREDSLRRLAVRMANRAQKTGRRVVMEPMNPYERRVMHTALQDHPAVETHSEGEEPNRHVVITLKAQKMTPAVESDGNEEGSQQKPASSRRRRSRRRTHKPRGEQKNNETTMTTDIPDSSADATVERESQIDNGSQD